MTAAASPPNGSRPRRGTDAGDDAPPPYNLDAEASILGGIILRNDVLQLLPEKFGPSAFFDPKHQIVFTAIRNLEAAGRPIDVVTIETEIEAFDRKYETHKLEAIGGVAFLGALAMRVPTADNVVDYANTVAMLYRRRRTMVALADAQRRAETWRHDPSELLSEVVGDLQRIEVEFGTAPKPIESKLIDPYRALEMLEPFHSAPIYETPFAEINGALGFGGLLGTQVYTLAAGTGAGKTTFVSAVASHNAEHGVPTLVSTYEMEPGYFVARRSAGLVGAHSNDILRGTVSPTLVSATIGAQLAKYLRYLHRPSLRELEAAIEWTRRKYGVPPLVVVDYLQKLADMVMATQQRPDMRLATTLISTELIEIAQRQRCAILSVSAIGRGKGKVLSNPRRAHPSELVEVSKESGAIEYDGAGVIVLSISHEKDGDEDIATMTVAKARFGSVCHIDARYHGARGLWRTLEVVPWSRSGKTETPASGEDDNSDAKVREAVIAVLRVKPMPSATAIVKATGKARQPVFAAVKELKREGLIHELGGFLTIRNEPQQGEIGGLE